jgi:hypothetical protein
MYFKPSLALHVEKSKESTRKEYPLECSRTQIRLIWGQTIYLEQSNFPKLPQMLSFQCQNTNANIHANIHADLHAIFLENRKVSNYLLCRFACRFACRSAQTMQICMEKLQVWARLK